jgi:hypothetical protein
MMNNGDGTFQSGIPRHRAASGRHLPGTGDWRQGRGRTALPPRAISTATVGLILSSNFNERAYYFGNNFRKNYVAFRLQGTKSNRDAIGALVTLYGKTSWCDRCKARRYLSHFKTVHFGLGERSVIDRVN